MSVPREEARIARIQYIGSLPSDLYIPYKGIWEQIKKINNIIDVQINFS